MGGGIVTSRTWRNVFVSQEAQDRVYLALVPRIFNTGGTEMFTKLSACINIPYIPLWCLHIF